MLTEKINENTRRGVLIQCLFHPGWNPSPISEEQENDADEPLSTPFCYDSHAPPRQAIAVECIRVITSDTYSN